VGVGVDRVDWDSTEVIDQTTSVGRVLHPVGVVRLLDDLAHHYPILQSSPIVAVTIAVVYHLQGRLESELMTGFVYMSVSALEVLSQIQKHGAESDRIEVSESGTQSPAVRKEFWTSEIAECCLKVIGRVGVRSDGKSSGSRVEVVGEGDSVTAGNLEDLVLDVAVESYVCDGWRRPYGHQSVRVECPFTAVVAES
jgi:hypothetical protein